VSGEDARVPLDIFTEGVVSGLEVSERGAGANLSVDVSPGLAVIEGANVDQGKYAAKIAGASAFNVTIGAADVSNPRIDEIYLVVLDDGYDSSGFVLPRIAVRDGTPASSPSAPGPDGGWDAYLLLATIAVAANETEITNAEITDGRVQAALVADLVTTDSIQDDAVTGPKIATDAVTPSKIIANAVSTSKIIDGAVTTSKIADDAVTVAKIANTIGIVTVGGGANTTSSALTTSFVDMVSDSFSLPSGWSSALIMAWGGTAVRSNGVPIAFAEARIEIGANNGTVGQAPGDGDYTMVARHEASVTGTVTVALAARKIQSGDDYDRFSASVSWIAVRTG
jgi:hypothetical protein